jgi:hypothetical protein
MSFEISKQIYVDVMNIMNTNQKQVKRSKKYIKIRYLSFCLNVLLNEFRLNKIFRLN